MGYPFNSMLHATEKECRAKKMVWMNLEDMLSERQQINKATDCMVTLT